MREATMLKCFSLILMCFIAPAIYLLHAHTNILKPEVGSYEFQNGLYRRLLDSYHPRAPRAEAESVNLEEESPSNFTEMTEEVVEVIEEEEEEEEPEIGECEEVHIAMTIEGPWAIRKLLTAVKSILFYRKNPIHFHFVVDDKSKHTILTLFKTWFLPEVKVSFYPISDAFEIIKWMPAAHNPSLVKLALVRLLPSSLKAVIVLDTDVMLASDIGKLWVYVRELRIYKKRFALVENHDEVFREDWQQPIGQNFHTAVMVLNLDFLRTTSWNQTLYSVTGQRRVVYSSSDVINAISRKYSRTTLSLPCVWNVQLSSEYCMKSANDFKIIHWSKAAKASVNNIHMPRFKTLLQMFEEFDSMLFRTYYSNCETAASPFSKKSQEEKPCADIRREAKLVRRVYPYYLNYSYKPTGDDDVTLVTQTTMDRIHMLESLVKHWEGPLSVALYASDSEMEGANALFSSSSVLRKTRRLALHVVSKTGKFYPYNHLRNIALDYANTPYIYILDVDFLPMPGLYKYAKEAVNFLGKSKRALIVPAFETFQYEVKFPTSKSELLPMLQEKVIFPFRMYAWKGGHGPTNFDHWITSNHPYTVKYKKGFEPYLIMSKNVPRYDERFIGYGGDKVSHVMELAERGYELMVLPKAFMIHMPHPHSRERAGFEQKAYHYKCIQVLQNEFMQEVRHSIKHS